MAWDLGGPTSQGWPRFLGPHPMLVTALGVALTQPASPQWVVVGKRDQCYTSGQFIYIHYKLRMLRQKITIAYIQAKSIKQSHTVCSTDLMWLVEERCFRMDYFDWLL